MFRSFFLCLILCLSVSLCVPVSVDTQTTNKTTGRARESGAQAGSSSTQSQLDAVLESKCFNNIFLAEWWSYVFCYRTGVRQVHYNHQSQRVESENSLGDFVPEESEADHQIFRGTQEDCLNENTGELLSRYSEVSIECCEETGRQVNHMDAAEQAGGVVIASVEEPVPCSYYLVVCARTACRPETVREIERLKVEAAATLAKAQQKRRLKELHHLRQRKAYSEHERALREKGVMHSGLNGLLDPGAGVDDPAEAELLLEEQLHAQRGVAVEGDEGADTSPSAEALLNVPTTSTAGASFPTTNPSAASAANVDKGDKGSNDATFMQDWHGSSPYRKRSPQYDIPTRADQARLRERVRDMFHHAYDAYMENGFPEAELRPLTCIGGSFDLIKIPLVTLIDTLDTLVVMGNHTEFRRAVGIVQNHYDNFDFDVNVSVFESTIRLLGGLLSAHLFAIDPQLNVYPSAGVGAGTGSEQYDGGLLRLAVDLGDRLLPAFKTNTGIPYGTVNLRHGVPRGETEIASTAGAGSLIVEFEALSSLSGDRRYGDAAYGALAGLFNRRSAIGLLGKHIHTDTGAWFESVSGIGSNSDSFYEYLLKAFLLFRRKDLYTMFATTYSAIKRFVQNGDWFSDVDMYNGKLRRHRTENLHAFWPGMEATLGYSESGARTLNALYSVWSDLGFLPEEMDSLQWLKGDANMHGYYPLRPELIESTYHQYRTTRDRSWLVAGEVFLDSLERLTPTPCGFASVGNLQTMALKDEMPSFFLSETLKYMYLLFDEDNFIHDRAYIFSTEAHPFDPMQLPTVPRNESMSGRGRGASSGTDTTDDSFHFATRFQDDMYSDDGELIDYRPDGKASGDGAAATAAAAAALPFLPSQCSKKLWWGETDGWVLHSITPLPPKIDTGAANGKSKPAAQRNAVAEASQHQALTESHKKMAMQHERLKKARAGVTAFSSGTGAGSEGGGSGEPPAEKEEEGRAVSGSETEVAAPEAEGHWVALTSGGPLSALLASLSKMAGTNTVASTDSSTSTSTDNKKGADPPSPHHALDTLHSTASGYAQSVAHDVLQYRRMTRVANAMHNGARMSALLARRYQQRSATPMQTAAADGGDGKATQETEPPIPQQQQAAPAPARRQNTCYAEDEPVMAGHQDALQTVDVSMGDLGDFTVHVYTDGFVVHSKTYGNTLEISNVGQPVMFVRDFDASSSKTVLGTITGDVQTCSVTVEAAGYTGDAAEAAEKQESTPFAHASAATADGDADEYLDEENTDRTIPTAAAAAGGARRRPNWERSCTAASFGPNHANQPIVGHTQAKYYSHSLPGRGGRLQKIDSACDFPAAEAANAVAGGSGGDGSNEGDGWFGGIFSSSASGGAVDGEAAPAASLADDANSPEVATTAEDVRGRTVIARRGECMFEDKAKAAYDAGAKAVIVINNEDGLFVMSGKGPNSAASGTATSSGSSSDDDGNIGDASGGNNGGGRGHSDKYGNMPTVMLVEKDGVELLDLLAAHAAAHGGEQPEVRIDIQSTPMVLDSRWMGSTTYPKVRMKSNIVHVASRKPWGAILSSATGHEWQLFIMSRREMPAVNVWPTTMLSVHEQQITSTAALSLNPLEIYRRTLSRQCPSFLQFGDFGVSGSAAGEGEGEGGKKAAAGKGKDDATVFQAPKGAPINLKIRA